MEIITYGGGLQLNALFTALAVFTDTGDFLGAIRVMLLVSIFVVAAEIAFTGTLKPAPRLLIAIFIIFAALFSRADIEIIDRVETANSTTVDDVPAGVAVVAHLASVTSDWFTEQFEIVFSMPDDIRYRNNGLLFANRLVQASTEMEIADQTFARNLGEFMRSCVYYGANAGWFSWRELVTADNVWSFINTEGVGAAIFTPYEDPGSGNVTLIPCTKSLINLNAGWADAIGGTAEVFGMRIFRKTDATEANAKLLSTLPLAYDYLSTISATGAEIVQQNVIINAMRRAFMTLAAEADASAAIQDFALARAEAQQRTTYQTLGALAARTLPLIKNILEMVIYGLFPILLLLVIVSIFPGKTIIFYAKALVWLHLWPPLYAILHFAMSAYSVDAVSANVIIPASVGGAGAGLAVMTQGGLHTVNADMAAMAGYLAWLIPLMSWGIMTAGGFAISQLAAGIGSVAQSAGSSAAGAASAGQISLGNSSLYNSAMFRSNTAPQQNTGVGMRVDPMTGGTMRDTQGGHQFLQTARQDVGLSTNLSEGIQSSVREQASSSLSAASQELKQFAEQSAANLNNVVGFTHNVNSSLSSKQSTGHTFSASVNEKADAIQTGLQQLADRHSMSTESALKAAIVASAGGKIPFTEFGIKGQIARQGSAANQAFIADLRQFSEQTNFGESWGQVLQASEQVASAKAASVGDSESTSVQASLQSAVRAQASSSASLTEARGWEAAAARMEQSGFATNFDAVAALKADMVGQPKSIATPGNNSPVWSQSEVNRLFIDADRGDTQAIGTILHEAQQFGIEKGRELAGVAAGGDGAQSVQTFYDEARSGVTGSDTVAAHHGSNTDAVRYSDRAASDLPGKEWELKSNALRADNTLKTVKTATDSQLNKVRNNLDQQGADQQRKHDDWREANIAGAFDDWIPGVE